MSEPADPPLFILFNEIGIIEQLARNRFERVLPEGLSLAGFTVLNHLVRLGDGKGPAELARAFQVRKPTMTHTLGRLAKAGLVDIAPDAKDRRAKRVTLTPQGRAAREAAITALLPELAGLKHGLPETDLEAILPTLQALRRHLDVTRP